MSLKERVVFIIFCFCSAAAFSQPVACFNPNKSSGCTPVTVSFADCSTGSPTTWTWNLGNGNSSSFQNGVGAVYSAPGTYTVTLTVSNNLGSNSTTSVITVFGNPKADFTTLPLIGCVGQGILFTDHSILAGGPVKTWDWVFGDGSSTTTGVGTINHSYVDSGSFPVTLLIADTNKCKSDTTITVRVNPDPKATFTATSTGNCGAPLIATFTNTSTVAGTVSYLWYFGDGGTSTTTNPQHTYVANGIYSVSLVVTQGGCRDSATTSNLIQIQPIVAGFSADTTKVCVGQIVSFTDLSVPAGTIHNWYFGDGGTSAAVNPTYSYAASGTYQVALAVTGTGGCQDSIAKPFYMTVNPLPRDSFVWQVQPGCTLPITVNFTDSSKGATTWLWNFGDGDTSSLQNPGHAFASAGPFTVTLTIKNSNGCSSVYQTSAANINLPKADFTAFPLSGCAPLNVGFTSTSVSSDSIASYQWFCGNDTLNTATGNASNVYTATGTYTVKLVITTKSGCKDSITKINYIRTGTVPNVGFGIADSNLCYGIPAQFINFSTNANSWHWYFGDGQQDSINKDPTHVYGDTGVFSVALVAYNNGCKDSITNPKIVTIFPPVPLFTVTFNCTNHFQVAFTSTSIGADSLVWNFGDGTFDVTNNPTPTHIYLSRGPVDVILTAYNKKHGCSAFLTTGLIITDPLANFSGSPLIGCYPLFTSFSDSSQDAVNYQWSFGDGNSSNVNDASNAYQLPGLYTVKLIITDINGCKDSITKAKYVDVLGPIPYFKADTTRGCAALQVVFIDTSKSDSILIAWKWNFGDGGFDSVSGPNTIHVYQLPGSYTVSMTITDKNGCTQTLTKPNYINPTFPNPGFVCDSLACRGSLVGFNASGTNAFNPVFEWNFADGNVDTSNLAGVTHGFASFGLFSVKLVVKDGNGCIDSVRHPVFIQKPHAGFSDSSLVVGCGVDQVQFRDLSTGYVNQWNWEFGPLGASSISQSPSYTYSKAGYYTIRLIVTSIAGCVDTLIADSVVLVLGPVGTFTFSPDKGCNPLTVRFIANSNNSENFTWDFGDGTVVTTSQSNIVHTYTKDMNVTPILLLGTTLPDGSFCQLPATNLTGNVVVSGTTTVSINPNVITLQQGSFTSVVPTVNFSGPYISIWSPAQGLDCPNCADVVITSSGVDLTYTLTVIDTSLGGCTAHDSIKVIEPPCKENFIIPNVFTPNADEINDVFCVKNLCQGYFFEMDIYNRWGEFIYTTDSNLAGWGGKTNAGLPAPSGTYFYVITIDKKAYNGFLSLLRQ